MRRTRADEGIVPHLGEDKLGLPNYWMLRYPATTSEDLEALAEIRVVAMRESLEAIGRFDPLRARQRLVDSFQPQHARWIELEGDKIGFYQLRPTGPEFRLDHLSIRLPKPPLI